mmetsp:Transcript_28588/g.85721  ORF Transcript_28588/g.85721 Transcript_28588/m.85721 type:complete len:257 (-) Transcript_28588:140-910(-)
MCNGVSLLGPRKLRSTPSAIQRFTLAVKTSSLRPRMRPRASSSRPIPSISDRMSCFALSPSAISSGRSPSTLTTSVLAPLARRRLTILQWSQAAAAWRGVHQSLSMQLALAPFWIRRVAILMDASMAAWCSADSPSAVVTFGSTPDSNSSSTSSTSSCDAASRKTALGSSLIFLSALSRVKTSGSCVASKSRPWWFLKATVSPFMYFSNTLSWSARPALAASIADVISPLTPTQAHGAANRPLLTCHGDGAQRTSV